MTMTAANRVKELRLAQGMLQRQLQMRASISPSVLTLIEKYSYRPTETIRLKIAAALGLHVDQVWPRE